MRPRVRRCPDAVREDGGQEAEELTLDGPVPTVQGGARERPRGSRPFTGREAACPVIR